MPTRRCEPCGESHGMRPGGRIVFRQYSSRARTTLRQLSDLISRYAENHPELQVGFDGDSFAIMGFQPVKGRGTYPYGKDS